MKWNYHIQHIELHGDARKMKNNSRITLINELGYT